MNKLSKIRKLIRGFAQYFLLPLGACILCGAQSVQPCCERCHRGFIGLMGQGKNREDGYIDSMITGYEFAYPLNHLIHAFKYQHNLALGNWFALQLEAQVAAENQTSPIDVVLGMPLHPRRLRQRGYNQSHEIARHLANSLGIPCKTECCFRRYHLKPQVELPLSERSALPLDLFECHQDLLGLHVLLVDDVMTTGTSLGRLARAVKLQGASRVTGCVIAQVSDTH